MPMPVNKSKIGLKTRLLKFYNKVLRSIALLTILVYLFYPEILVMVLDRAMQIRSDAFKYIGNRIQLINLLF